MNNKKSLEEALRKIQSIFLKEDVSQITIQRKYLPEIFTADLLEISKIDGLPILKLFVIDFFKTNNILSLFDANEAQFKIIYNDLIKLKEEQLKTLENSLLLKDEQIKTLEKTIIRELISSASNKDTIKEMDDTIISLQKEIELLKKELTKTDVELTRLKAENEKLR